MKTVQRFALAMAVAAGLVPFLAGSASGHSLSSATLSCSTVSGTFEDFTAGDHPIVWHVKVGNGAFQTVATTESPAAFVGSGTASASITTLTDELHGTSAAVAAFATWPTGQSATTTQTLTCGTAVSPATTVPTTTPTTLPTLVAGAEATAPTAPSFAAAVSPAVAVAVSPRFTG